MVHVYKCPICKFIGKELLYAVECESLEYIYSEDYRRFIADPTACNIHYICSHCGNDVGKDVKNYRYGVIFNG